jgi:capsular exopolysaccharide synthesis family protein
MNPSPGVEANALRYYVAVLRRRWLWVVLGVAVGLLAGFASTLLVKEERDPNSYYKATHTIVVNGAGGNGSTANLPQAAFLIHSREITDQLAADLGTTSQAVNDQLSAIARSDVLAIDVTAIGTDPNQVVTLADAGAAALTEFVVNDTNTQTQAQRDALNTRKAELVARQNELIAIINLDPESAEVQRAELATVTGDLEEVDQAIEDLGPIGGVADTFSTLQPATAIQINGNAYSKRLNENRNSRGAPVVTTVPAEGEVPETDLSVGPPISRTTRVLIGGAAGLVMGLAGAFLVEAWDDRIRKRERVEHLTGLAVIAEVPRLPKDTEPTDIVVIDAPRSRAAERYRSVRTAVLFALHEHLGTGPKSTEPGIKWSGTRAPVLMVTSPNPSEGKTTTVANLAAVFADGGMRTLVIDCDYRKPAVARYLAPRASTEHDGQLSETRVDGVMFAPAPRGADSPGAAVGLLRDTIEQWRDHVDMVLLDTPPMLTTNDATDLLAAADAVVLVLRAGQTRAGHAERVANVLARYRADTLGIVLNSCDEADIDAYYGYYRGYVDDGPPEPSAEGRSRIRRREVAPERPTTATPT